MNKQCRHCGHSGKPNDNDNFCCRKAYLDHELSEREKNIEYLNHCFGSGISPCYNARINLLNIGEWNDGTGEDDISRCSSLAYKEYLKT